MICLYKILFQLLNVNIKCIFRRYTYNKLSEIFHWSFLFLAGTGRVFGKNVIIQYKKKEKQWVNKVDDVQILWSNVAHTTNMQLHKAKFPIIDIIITNRTVITATVTADLFVTMYLYYMSH